MQILLSNCGHMFIFFAVLDILKKNFTNLCNCLPQNCMTTIDRVKKLNVVSDDALQRLRNISDKTIVNEWIMSVLMVYIKSDVDMLLFCDRMNQLVDSTTSKLFVDSLKEGIHTYMMIIDMKSLYLIIKYIYIYLLFHGMDYYFINEYIQML